MKKEYILIGAAGLAAVYFLMPKGEDAGPGSSGGLGAGLGGLPSIPGQGGGGADTPTVNIDFPNIPTFPLEPPPPGETKKEQQMTAGTTPYNVMGDYTRDTSWKQDIGKSPSPDYSTYIAPTWKDPSNPNMTGQDIKNMIQSQETKKEQAMEQPSVYDLFIGNPLELGRRLIMGEPISQPAKTSTSYSLKGEGSVASKGGETARSGGTKKEQAKIDYAARGYSYAGSSGGVSIYGSSIPGGLSSTLSSAMRSAGVTSVRY